MAVRRISCVEELEEIISTWNDASSEIAGVNILPPDQVGDLTDEENLNDDSIQQNDNIPTLNAVAGTFEIETFGSIDDIAELTTPQDHAHKAAAQDKHFSGKMALPSTSRKRGSETQTLSQTKQQVLEIGYKPLSAFPEPHWKSLTTDKIEYSVSPNNEPLANKQQELFDTIKDLSPLQLFLKLFDDEVISLIVRETNRYAGQQNSTFLLDIITLKRFIGILLLSGYHTLPNVNDYWSNEPSLGVPIVKQCMSRNKFREIKKFIHFSDNYNLNKMDKMAKLRSFFEVMNQKFMQFGVFSDNLSIDEQMVPYFGRHSCKMYIKGKPIRFGYKVWCLCSTEGYLYQFMPYCGASDNYNRTVGLGADVVLRLLGRVEHPTRYVIYFDNFFTSYLLMLILTELKIAASGTVRSNRVGGALLKTGKELPKGQYHCQLDDCNKIVFCRWQDNKEVTIATNFDQIKPTHSVKRWRKGVQGKSAGELVTVQQPHVLYNYNKNMGGVDLHDNAAQNYRINIRSKKWYWPLWINALNSAVVNSWKLHCFVAKHRGETSLHQKEFRVLITQALLLTGDPTTSDEEKEVEDFVPNNIPRISGGHLIIRHPELKDQLVITSQPNTFGRYHETDKTQMALSEASFMPRCNIDLTRRIRNLRRDESGKHLID
ncbi:piggyBac transposable element-derived protein 3-like [Toxorhynchites rutilus septentrionalis]|uniref:piggyBac transposable element-derived protein 3-like n=1 Tax=Toxorhynchites rutilus septentrionalis TaxID=329112 RepID=UPI002479D09A|nr:piggyBac transposable element-derived protein 3-like [Toxorhynchites rutilus septentrionalis]